MANFPGIPQTYSKKGDTSTSLFPAAVREAKAATVSVSLFLIVALCGGAYYAGRDAGRGVSAAEIALLMKSHDTHLESIARSTASLERLLDLQGSHIAAIESRMGNMQAQVEVVRSHVEGKR